MINLNPFFKSIIDQDNTAIVVCDLNHTIVYMNPFACEAQAKRGGAALIGYYEKHEFRTKDETPFYEMP